MKPEGLGQTEAERQVFRRRGNQHSNLFIKTTHFLQLIMSIFSRIVTSREMTIAVTFDTWLGGGLSGLYHA